MSDYIYILIGIIWVVYSLYSANQKAAQKKQGNGFPPTGPSQSSPLPIPGNPGGGKSLLEDIFRELTGEAKPIPQPSTSTYPTQSPVQPVQARPATQSVANPARPGNISAYAADLTSKGINDNPVFGANDGQTNKNENISKKFDLREAVIFSELLNRKYF
jgi:hypothetical protein